jgi:hypothetical protein
MLMMEMYEVESSQILRIGYDIETGIARVEFKRKDGSLSAIWEYGDAEHHLSLAEFEEWKNAPSVGSFFGKHIKGIYRNTCIEKR